MRKAPFGSFVMPDRLQTQHPRNLMKINRLMRGASAGHGAGEAA
jgi:hypothetical protein